MHASPAEVSPQGQEVAPLTSPPQPPNRSLVIRTVAASALLVIAALLFAALRHGNVARQASTANSTAPFGPSALRLTGTTEAVHMRAIVAPMLTSETFSTLTITPGGRGFHLPTD